MDHAIIAVSPRRIAAIVDELQAVKNFTLPAYAEDGIHTAGNKKMTLLGFILREDAALVTDGPSDREPIHHTRLKLVREGKRFVTVA